MICAVDANVLIYAVLEAMPEHKAVKRFFKKRILTGELTCAITFHTLLELVHVTTDPKRFDPPLQISESITLAEKFWNASNWRQLLPHPETGTRTLELMKRLRLGRKRLLDTFLAAILLDNGVKNLITCDEADFLVYPELHLINPLK